MRGERTRAAPASPESNTIRHNKDTLRQQAGPRLNLAIMSARPDAAAILAETKSRRLRARIYQVIGVLLVAGVAGGVFFWRSKSSKAKGVRYLTAAVQAGDLKETVTATGTLKGLDSVDVGAQISGKITKINVDFNDQVKVGQVLAEIDTAQMQSRVDQSKAQVSAADASLVLAKATQAQTKAQYLRSVDLSQK